MELTLYKREMKGSWKLLVIFGAVLTMYVAIIISMYEPDMLKLLDSYAQAMPELMMLPAGHILRRVSVLFLSDNTVYRTPLRFLYG